MPIYEFECKACGLVQEVMQKVSDPAPEACSKCNSGPLTKLMSRTGFILKGGGWYVTDFRGGNKPGKQGGGAPASGGDAAAAGADSSDKSGGDSGSSSGDSGSSAKSSCAAGACGAHCAN